MTADEATSRTAIQVEPWERWGWLMFAIWLAFLSFPLVSALDSSLAGWQHAVGIGAILVFGGVYLHAFFWAGGHSGRHPWWHLSGMLALIGLASTAIGVDALGMTPFLVSMTMFTATVRAALVVAGMSLVACAGLTPATEDTSTLLYALILVSVTCAVTIVRVLEDMEASTRKRNEEASILAERDRVARDVHDVLGHSLTVVTVKAELAERLIGVDDDRVRAELLEIQSLTRQALAEVRATVSGLRVARLADELEAATLALAGAGIEADFEVDPAVVDPRFRIVLAWSLREAITNVVRHSGATRCTVNLGEDWLRVDDDGAGRRGRREGNGLRGLRERVGAAGGRVDLEDRTDGGTLVTVKVGSPR